MPAVLSEGDVRATCELFWGRYDQEVADAFMVATTSPYEIPYWFFDRYVADPGCRTAMPDLAPSRRHVELAYGLILQRRPESEEAVQVQLRSCSSVKVLVQNFFLSEEFRERASALVSARMTSVPRLWHVHIPRTAGSRFVSSWLDAGWGVVNATLLISAQTTSLDRIAGSLGLSRLRRGIVFTGHKTLDMLRPSMLPLDSTVAFVRDPLERVLSFFDFVAGLLRADPTLADGGLAPIVRRGFDVDSFEGTYLCSDVYFSNEQCLYLSSSGYAQAALDAATLAGCELYPVSAVESVVREKTGLELSTLTNASDAIIDRAALPARLRRRILRDNAEDAILYKTVRDRSGLSLARQASS